MPLRGKKRLGYDLNISAWFGRASAFHFAFSRMPELSLLPANIVSCSFSIETYFKTLKAIEGGDRPLKEHNLLCLFNDISDDSKGALERAWNEIYGHDIEMRRKLAAFAAEKFGEDDLFKPRTITNALDDAQEAFVAFRYADGLIDKAEECPGFAAWAVPDLLRGRILEMRPDLKPEADLLFARLDQKSREPQFVKRHYNQARVTITYSQILISKRPSPST